MDISGNVESEILTIFDCETQITGGVRVQCFYEHMKRLILETEFNDVREYCKIDLQDKEMSDDYALRPDEFKNGLLETFDLKEDYEKYLNLN